MNFPEEQHRIDVTTEERHYKDRPPTIQPRKKPRRPKRELRLPTFTPWDGFARVHAAWERASQATSRAVRRAMRRPLPYVLEDFQGRWLVLCWYPADFTFVCPTELLALSDRLDEFTALDAAVLGASTESPDW